MSRISAIYLPATWRNITTFDSETGHMGLGFDLAGGDVVRISIDETHARHLAEAILHQLPHTPSAVSARSESFRGTHRHPSRRAINRFVICTRGFSFKKCPPVLRKFLCHPLPFKLFGKLGVFHLKIAKGFLQIATFFLELSKFIFEERQSS